MPHPFSETVMFFLNATDLNDPILNIYTYGASTDSWLHTFNPDTNTNDKPDSILSSKTTPGFVESMSVTDVAGKRIFDFTINTAYINNYTPMYPTTLWPWKGFGFAHNIGVWFHPAYITQSSYNTSSTATVEGFQPGFLKEYERHAGFLDVSDLITVDCHGNPRVVQGLPVPGDTFDGCGVCGGDNSSCADCAGTPNGTAVVDQCGVCGGNGTSCLDCVGVPNGTTKVDLCGVCGGNNTSCIDCAGTPNGTAATDACGVCNGDGSSCISCIEKDLSATQTKMDGGAKKLERAIKFVVKNILTVKSDKKTKAYAAKLLTDAHALQVRNWILSWTIPSVNRQCAESLACFSISNQSFVDEYHLHNSELRKLGLDAIKKWQKLTSKTKVRSSKALIEKLFSQNKALADTIPQSTFKCVGQV